MAIESPSELIEVMTPAMTVFDSISEVEAGRRGLAPVEQYFEMMTKSPIIRPAVKAKTLMAVNLTGEYDHPDPEIKEWVQGNLEQVDGSWAISLSEFYISAAIGFTATPIEFKLEGGDYRLDRLLSLDPRYVRFLGQLGEPTYVKYYGQTKDSKIPYSQVVHIINDSYLTPDRTPYGAPECETAHAAWTAWKTVMGHTLVSSQIQATRPLVGKTKSQSVVLLDADGQPVLDPETGEPSTKLSTDVLRDALKALRNGGVVVVGEDELVEAVESETEGEFFQWFLTMLERLQLLAYLVPETTFSVGRGGLGNVTLSDNHADIFIRAITALVNLVTEKLIECVITPLVDWKFGQQETYGQFIVPEEKAEDVAALVSSISTFIAALVNSGAGQDLEPIINRARQLLGVDDIDVDIARAQQPQPPMEDDLDDVEGDE